MQLITSQLVRFRLVKLKLLKRELKLQVSVYFYRDIWFFDSIFVSNKTAYNIQVIH
jgi:hypothetical protein